MNLKAVVLFFLLFVSIVAYSQQNVKIIDHSNSTIPSDQLQAISVDQHGIKWISFKSGLYKYNGKTFDMVAKAVPGGYYGPIYTDRKGNIWTAFSGNAPGVVRYSEKGATI